MREATQQELMLTLGSGERIVRVEIINNGHGIKYYTVPENENIPVETEEFEKMFPIVEIEKVSLEDSFMQYEPKNSRENKVKASIIRAKEIEMKNFRKPAMDPSFADDGKTIIYCAGRKPAVGKSAVWWEENAPKFMPEKNSRQIDDLEKHVFLGVLIKYLVEEENYKVEEAWKMVNVDSKKIGHYYDSKEAKREFERTGSRQIGKWFDLGNTCKIVKKREESGFMIFGGDYGHLGGDYPLADCFNINFPCHKYINSVGEIVLDV